MTGIEQKTFVAMAGEHVERANSDADTASTPGRPNAGGKSALASRLETISSKADYKVFLTPSGECEGLYVANRTANSFEVRELHQGTSNVQFDYRIVANRKGLESTRMPELSLGTPKPQPTRQGVRQLPGSN